MAKITPNILLLVLALVLFTSASPIDPPPHPAPINYLPTPNFTLSHRNQNLTLRSDSEAYTIWLSALRALPTQTPPYCIPSPSTPQKCTFATRSYALQTTSEWFIYDNNCNVLGHWGNNLIPSKDMGMYSQLPYVVVSSQEGPDRPPTMKYAAGSWERSSCWNGGGSLRAPGFRLACMIEFVCEAKQEKKGWKVVNVDAKGG